MALHPAQSFQHTLREISVNRADPCELVRELISNSYDAGAREIRVFPLAQKHGLIFFDDGSGLSISEQDRKNDVLPYVAFFSIGKGTKTMGHQIGYKCQGSKLCFASRRFALITRCPGEPVWRWKLIDNPKQTLDTNFDITPQETPAPWQVLKSTFLPDADERTSAVLTRLDEAFFTQSFKHGTLLYIEEFETDSFERYFSVEQPAANYLYNYIRFYTAHGDIRRISREQGFTAGDVKAVRSLIKPDVTCTLQLWLVDAQGNGQLHPIPQGWPYLPPPHKEPSPPAEVHQLRGAQFYARHATAFKFQDRYYAVILAIDGNRRALDQYPELGRQRNRRSGLSLAHTRGVLLSSGGIVVCQYQQLFDSALLEDWAVLNEGKSHFVLIIDGTFELVTNRDALAPSSMAVLRDAAFAEQIRDFLREEQTSQRGLVFAQLLDRLKRETTRHEENHVIDANSRLRRELAERESFIVTNVAELADRPILVPARGEEHFVGALYTLFSHIIPAAHPLSRYWIRPLTFAGWGIDAVACVDEQRPLTNGNLSTVEYKFAFTAEDQFNHPLSITDRILYWDGLPPAEGSLIEDSYGYVGTASERILHDGQVLGFILRDIRQKNALRALNREILVLQLRALLKASFAVTFRGARPNLVASSATKPPRRKR